MKFRKKPVVVEAVQWNGNLTEMKDFIGDYMGDYVLFFNPENKIIIHTLEGEMTAQIGDWVIKGVNDEFYPCKPDIFEKTYEKVEE